jgi:hypothetical protein
MIVPIDMIFISEIKSILGVYGNHLQQKIRAR